MQSKLKELQSEFEMMQEAIGKDRPLVYLGDGAYAGFDGYQIWLYTGNGLSITNRVALDPYVWQALLEFSDTLGQSDG